MSIAAISKFRLLGRFALYALLALLIITPIRIWVAQPFVVSGNSMLPSLQEGDYLIVDELSYATHNPQRGDLIIFHYPLDPNLVFIKRIVALPGEGVRVHNGIVTITSSSSTSTRVLSEPYRAISAVPKEDVSVRLHDDEYYVLGDNRIASSDSRAWGPLLKTFIIGRASMRLLPFPRMGLFRSTTY